MALPKKHSRSITLADTTYRWIASGNDGWIDLYIECDDGQGQLLTKKFDYHPKEVEQAEGISLQQQFVVTPDIVRRSIEMGIQAGWKPQEKGKIFDLHHIDEQIDWGK